MALHSLYCADVPWRNCSLTTGLWRTVRRTVRRSDRIYHS